MASFVSFFYNRGGSVPRSQIRNGGSFMSRVTARFRAKPGIFDRMRACRTPAQLRGMLDGKSFPLQQHGKIQRRAHRHLREMRQRATAATAAAAA